MNTIIQNILVFAALALAIGFLVKKFFWTGPSKSKKSVGHHDCDNCH